MNYKKAVDVLPDDILNIIQEYIQGEYIYIPKREGNRKEWGESTKSKSRTYLRNLDIYKQYEEGMSTKELAERYYLSPKSIQKIVANMRQESAS